MSLRRYGNFWREYQQLVSVTELTIRWEVIVLTLT